MKKFYGFILSAVFGLVVLAAASTASQAEERPQKGGAQLWSESCARCHNMRSPSAHSDKEWSVIAHHMRVRANLTAEEHKAILKFLKSGN